jgi:rRNA small subunit pseudouridine methyltransferase Nep1
MGRSAGGGKRRESGANGSLPGKWKRARAEQQIATAEYMRVLQGETEEKQTPIPAEKDITLPENEEPEPMVKEDEVSGSEAGTDEDDSDSEADGEDGIRSTGNDNNGEGDEGEDKVAVTADVSDDKSLPSAGKLEPTKSRPVHVTVVLESANLEAIKLPSKRGGHALLSSDEHGTMLRKMKRDPNDARPDITHQCLLMLLDSPLNKAGMLTVYIRTKRNVLIAVHSQTRIPRTIRRFSGLMVELLERLKVRSTNGTKPLLQVIRNPITSHLPVGQRRIVCTYNCDNIVDVRRHAKDTVENCIAEAQAAAASRPQTEDQDDEARAADRQEPIQVMYIVGAMAHGKVDVDYGDESICISEYPLSAATVCSRITNCYENLAGIL